MNITYCERYVQIELCKDTRLLERVLDYVCKHFSKHYRLSSSMLILDDEQRFKKDYLINWVYHASLRNDKAELEEILDQSHLPIRIKIVSPNDMLQKVKIRIHLSTLGQLILRLEEDSRVAKRYIKTLFRNKIAYETDEEVCINSAGYSESMWGEMMNLISSRVIHNVALEFVYEKFEGSDAFLTREEYLLRKCYNELNARVGDDFASVKKRYLSLAKIFHPDNVQQKDEHTIALYQERFNKISQAYKTIKQSVKTIA